MSTYLEILNRLILRFLDVVVVPDLIPKAGYLLVLLADLLAQPLHLGYLVLHLILLQVTFFCLGG